MWKNNVGNCVEKNSQNNTFFTFYFVISKNKSHLTLSQSSLTHLFPFPLPYSSSPFSFSYEKCYFDTVFSFTSVSHSDVACAVPRGNERENAVVFGLRGLPLSFCKGVFCHFPSENAGQFEREKQISFLIALITPHALKEREQRKTLRFAFVFHYRSSSVYIGGIEPKP